MFDSTTVTGWGDFRTGGVHYSGATQLRPIPTSKKRHRTAKRQHRKVDPVLVDPVPIVLDDERRVKASGKKRVQGNALILAAVKQVAYDRTNVAVVKTSDFSKWVAILLTKYAGVGFDGSGDHESAIPKLFLKVDNEGTGDFVTCNFNKTAYKRKFVSSSVDPEKMKLLLTKARAYATPGAFTYASMIHDGLVLKGTRKGTPVDIPFADPRYLAPMVAEHLASENAVQAPHLGTSSGTVALGADEYARRLAFSVYYSSYTSFDGPTQGAADAQWVPTPDSCNAVLGTNMKKIASEPKFYKLFNGRDAAVFSEHVGWTRPFGEDTTVFPADVDMPDNCVRLKDEIADLGVPCGGEAAMSIMCEGWLPDGYVPVYDAWKSSVIE